MTISTSDNTPRISYSVSEGASQSSFAVPFEFFADADLNVYLDGTLKTISTHYSVSGGSGTTGSISMSVTGASGGSTVIITRGIALDRTTDFPTSGSFAIGTLNTELDRFVAIQADLNDTITRSVRLQDEDTAVSMELPLKADRVGAVLAFNASTGAAEAGPKITAVQSLSGITTSVNLLGTAAVVEDMGLLATSAVIEDMGLLATSANVTAMGLLGVSGVITDMGILGTAAIVEDMGILGTSANVTAMGLLGTAAVVEDMGLLSASAVIEDMGLLGTSANVTAMGILGTSANVTAMAALSASAVVADMALLATTDVIADMALLANSDVISDLNTLATSDIVSDLNTLATSDIVSDINTLATSDIVSDLNTLATSDIVTDINLLATSAIVADLNLLATSDVIADMASLAGSGGSPNISAISVSGNANVAGEVQTTKIAFTDGDDAMTITDTGLVEFNTGFNIGSDAAGDVLYNNGSKYVRLAKGTDGQALVLASGVPSWAAVTTDISGKASLDGATFTGAIQANGGVVFNEGSADVDFRVESNGNANMLFVDGGNDKISVGHGAPTAILDVRRGDAAGVVAEFHNTSGFGIDIGTDSDSVAYISSGYNQAFGLKTNAGSGQVERMRITSAGNVGIGTTAPLRQLHIFNTSANSEIAFTASTSGTSSLLFGDGQTGTDVYRGYLQYQHNGDYMLLAASAATVVRLDSDGLKFGADSAAANALSDYEEGEFVVTCNNSVTLKSAMDTMAYTKIGRLVVISGQLQVDSDNSNSGFAINNLPFASMNGTENAGESVSGSMRLYNWDVDSDIINPVCWDAAGSTTLYFTQNKDNAAEATLLADADAYIKFTYTYMAT